MFAGRIEAVATPSTRISSTGTWSVRSCVAKCSDWVALDPGEFAGARASWWPALGSWPPAWGRRRGGGAPGRQMGVYSGSGSVAAQTPAPPVRFSAV